MRRAAPFSALTALVAAGHVQAGVVAPRPSPFPPQPTAEERMRQVTHPYNPCGEALESFSRNYMYETLMGTVLFFDQPDHKGIQVEFNLNGTWYRHFHPMENTPESSAAIKALRMDRLTNNLKPMVYHPLVRNIAWRGEVEVGHDFRLTLLRNDQEAHQCQFVFSDAAPAEVKEEDIPDFPDPLAEGTIR